MMEPVTIVMASDSNYVVPLAATTNSIIANASPERRYELIVLNSGITDLEKEKLRSMLPGNFKLSYIEMSGLGLERLFTGHREHITTASWYRLLIPELLDCDKAVYTDIDVVFRRDIADLYDEDVSGVLAGVVHEGDAYTMWKQGIGDVREYWQEIGADPQAFFHSGSMVMNLKALRAEDATEKMLSMAESRDWLFHDLDVLNLYMAGRVRYIDASWAAMRCEFESAELIGDPIYDAYLKSIRDPWQVHYGGEHKPWGFPGIWRGGDWWENIIGTPFALDAIEVGRKLREKLSEK